MVAKPTKTRTQRLESRRTAKVREEAIDEALDRYIQAHTQTEAALDQLDASKTVLATAIHLPRS